MKAFLTEVLLAGTALVVAGCIFPGDFDIPPSEFVDVSVATDGGSIDGDSSTITDAVNVGDSAATTDTTIAPDVAGCVTAADCGIGLSCCTGVCVDTSADPAHCGGCGNTSAGGGCCAGVEVNLQSDANCGTCGNSCGPERECRLGVCGDQCDLQNPCADLQRCCDGVCLPDVDPSQCEPGCGTCQLRDAATCSYECR